MLMHKTFLSLVVVALMAVYILAAPHTARGQDDPGVRPADGPIVEVTLDCTAGPYDGWGTGNEYIVATLSANPEWTLLRWTPRATSATRLENLTNETPGTLLGTTTIQHFLFLDGSYLSGFSSGWGWCGPTLGPFDGNLDWCGTSGVTRIRNHTCGIERQCWIPPSSEARTLRYVVGIAAYSADWPTGWPVGDDEHPTEIEATIEARFEWNMPSKH